MGEFNDDISGEKIMGTFIIYSKNTGDILRLIGCPTSIAALQPQGDDEAIIEGTADDMCDQINLETKEVMKDYKTSRAALREEEERKRVEEAPALKREALIKERVERNARNKAEQELIDEGIIEENKL